LLRKKKTRAETTRGTNRGACDLFAQALYSRLKNMKMLKRLFGLSWLRRDARQSPDYPQPSIDPDEFTRLLCSRRVEDLRILAKKLSRQPRAHA
jgi:hypothetical protein